MAPHRSGPEGAALDGAWIARLASRAAMPPARARDSLRLGTAQVEIGSIEPALGARLVAAGLPLQRVAGRWHVIGSADASLAQIARWLDANGIGGRWRDELLAVVDAAGAAVGRIERAAVRPLGLTTQAVHLVGRTTGATVWVQQRAFDKSTDPGLWDTLMGGQVAAGESSADTLARETLEEAGLALDALEALVARGRLTIRRPVADGYMVEHIDLFEAVVPAGVEPANRDGEVARFACIDAPTLREWLRSERFTLEAALILVRLLPDFLTN